MNRGTIVTVVLGTAFGLMFGCGPSKAPEGSGGGGSRNPPASRSGLPPLFELLGQLPKERWPKDTNDTLKFEQAMAWCKTNVVGKRVSWTGLNPSEVRFASDGGDKYSASWNSTTRHTLWGQDKIQVFLSDGGIGHTITTRGLSEKAAEKLRAWPKNTPLEITFAIKEVGHLAAVNAPYVSLVIEQVAIEGLDP